MAIQQALNYNVKTRVLFFRNVQLHRLDFNVAVTTVKRDELAKKLV